MQELQQQCDRLRLELDASSKEREALRAKVQRLQVALSKASKAEVAAKQELDAALARAAETETSAKQSIEQIAEAANFAVQQQVGIAKQQHIGKDNATEYRISGA